MPWWVKTITFCGGIMTTGINQYNNICIALNTLYASLLNFIDEYEFNDQQEKLIHNLKLNLEIALPFGKYTTSKLEDFKKKEDPTYNNQKQFFEEDKDYISEMYDEIKELRKEYKNYEVKEIDEEKFFSEPIDSYRKYELVRNYEEAYKTSLLLDLTFTLEQRKQFKDIIKKLENCYYMSYRMCRKLDDYRKKYPFSGDIGLWKKDQKMKEIKHHAKRFKRLNEKRINERKK